MSSPIFQRIADELNLPPDRSEKLVRAMIQEIRKRAQKGQGVRIPNLGSFSVEDGGLQFRPEPSLARAVNQRFEGLDDEPVALPEIDESEQTGEGPTTITRGFDMNAWDPLETNEGQQAAPNQTAGDHGADTDEFQVPADAPDTDEFEVPAEASPDESEDESEEERDVDLQPAGVAAASSGSVPQDRSSAEATPASSGATSSDTFSGPAQSTSDNDWASDRSATDATGRNRASSATANASPETGEADTSSSGGSVWGRNPEQNASDSDSDAPEAQKDDGTTEAREEPEAPAKSDDPGETESVEQEAGDDKPSIWDADSSWDFSTVSSSDVDEDSSSSSETESDAEQAAAPTGSSSEGESAAVSYRPPDADEQLSEYDDGGRSIFDFDEDDEKADEPKEAPKTMRISAVGSDDAADPEASGKDSSGSSSLATTLTVTFLVLLIGAGAWIVLGQQGIVPSPSRTLGLSEGLTTQAETPADDPSNGGQAPAASLPGDGESTGEAGSTADSTPSTAEGANASTRDGAAPDGSEDSDSGTAPGFNRARGGYTIVVASRTSESQAQAVVEQFRQDLSDTNLPVDIVTGSSGNVTRYRVGVGQFSSLSDARARLGQMQSRLPNGSWPVQIQ